MGVNERHDCDSSHKTKAIGVATIPEGRLTYMRDQDSDSASRATMITKSFVLEGELSIDAQIADGGSIQVRLLDPLRSSAPFKGFNQLTYVFTTMTCNCWIDVVPVTLYGLVVGSVGRSTARFDASGRARAIVS